MIPPNLVSHPRHLQHLPDCVYAHNVGAGENRGGYRCGRCPITRRSRHLLTKRSPEKRLSGGARDERTTQFAELVKSGERFETMRCLFGEAEPRVDQDSFLLNPRASRKRDALAQL